MEYLKYLDFELHFHHTFHLEILFLTYHHKYQYEFGIQTDYYISNYNPSADGDLVITKCSESDETSYYIHRNEDHTLCSFLHRYHEQNK